MLTPLLSPNEVAQYLGVRLKTVHEYVRQGELGCVQISPKERKFTEEQVLEFLERKSKPAKKPIDKRASKSVTYPQKGGAKSVKDSGTSLTTEEIRRLCQ